MANIFTEETLSRRSINVMPSLDDIPDQYIKQNNIDRSLSLRRGDCVLMDKVEGGKMTGEKELVIVAGFTYHYESYPHLLIWFGEPEEIAKAKKFVVAGQSYTKEFEKRISRIKIPDKISS